MSNRLTLDDAMHQVWKLACASTLHRDWAVREIERLFWSPVSLGQYRLYYDKTNENSIGIATWAYMPLAPIEEFVAGKLKLEHKHWQGSRYWGSHHKIHTFIVDMIALDNSCRAIVSSLRDLFRGQTCFALRRNHGERRLAEFRGYPDVSVQS